MTGYRLTGHWDRRGGAWILALSGQLNDLTEPLFEQILARYQVDGLPVVLDASGLEHVSSIGYSLWLQLASRVEAAGGAFTVAAAPPQVSRPLSMVFGDHIPQVSTVEAALGTPRRTA
ncbi:MAG: STAS domain-containing protein [bacterium]|nr:STAS domain-containing protein [bacterium]